MAINRYFLSDFVTVQRQSFFELLEKGLIEEFAKRNPITNGKKDYSFFFYPEYYILTRPEYKPHEAIFKNKSYTSKLFVPVQITNKKHRKIILKWVYIGNIPLMTKRGHFILNGAARVIVNQILRSPGIYYQQKIYENYEDRPREVGSMSSNPEDDSLNQNEEGSALQPVNLYRRFYCDLICMRGSWLRIEMDKEKNIWAQMKKGPKIPIYWFLLAMGLSEKVILKSIMDPQKLLGNLDRNQLKGEARQPKTKKKTNNNNIGEKNAIARSRPYGDEPSLPHGSPPPVGGRAPSLIGGVNLQGGTEGLNKNTIERLAPPLISIRGEGAITGSARPSIYSAVQKPGALTGPESGGSSDLMDELDMPSKKVRSPAAATNSKKQNYPYLKNTPEAWQAIYTLLHSKNKTAGGLTERSSRSVPARASDTNYAPTLPATADISTQTKGPGRPLPRRGGTVPPINMGGGGTKSTLKDATDTNQESSNKRPITLGGTTSVPPTGEERPAVKNVTELGRQWLYNRFMNPRSYDLGKQGRIAFNKKLGLTIESQQLTLTGLDVLYATDYLIKVEKGIFNTDDIDHLKNRRVRTSGELIQIQIGVGLVRLEKFIRYNENMLEGKHKELNNIEFSSRANTRSKPIRGGALTGSSHIYGAPSRAALDDIRSDSNLNSLSTGKTNSPYLVNRGNSSSGRDSQIRSYLKKPPVSDASTVMSTKTYNPQTISLTSSISSIINNKAFNSAIREFFGTSPLSQFMDQINPLAELTHKRRLSSMGPGGVTRDTATLAIRGIHPTHYGRICPIETPEGKNTGLVNSMTTYARVNSSGILESPFYKVYKGQVQKNTGMYYLNAEQEEKIKLAAADLFVSPIGFLPKAMIPARIAETFTKISRTSVQYIGVSPLQMISIAASLIPFLEHDDANRALMGSNMQRQAVPLIRHERPIVGTGLEGRAVSDSGHVIQAKYSGLVTYVSAKKIFVSEARQGASPAPGGTGWL